MNHAQIGLVWPQHQKCVVTMRDGLTATPKMCSEPWVHRPYSYENCHAHAPQNSVHFRVSSDFTREWTSFLGGFSAHNLLPEIDPLSSGELSGCKDGDSRTRTRTSPKNRTSGTCTGDCKVGPQICCFKYKPILALVDPMDMWNDREMWHNASDAVISHTYATRYATSQN